MYVYIIAWMFRMCTYIHNFCVPKRQLCVYPNAGRNCRVCAHLSKDVGDFAIVFLDVGVNVGLFVALVLIVDPCAFFDCLARYPISGHLSCLQL
jgi:hypothetical protein